MDTKARWETIHGSKAPDAVSWYTPHLETSLAFIARTKAGDSAPIIDIGGGQSTLAEDLLARGYQDITVLDISATALEAVKERLGKRTDRIRWIAADVTNAELPRHHYAVWHDRAVFHFLTSEGQRAAYIQQAVKALKPGGNLILATFAQDGPSKCSGMEVTRYSAASLTLKLGSSFRLIESAEIIHRTPSGAIQPFTFCRFQLA